MRVLVVSQVYVPDPAAVGQHVADLAEALTARGHDVQVITSRGGYDDPRVQYPRREQRNGVAVHRVGLSSLGKRFILVRVIAALIFCLQAAALGISRKRFDLVIVTTAPPIGCLAGLLIKWVRSTPYLFWVLDLNPEQSIALGLHSEHSTRVRLLRALNRRGLREAADIIVLDSYMEHTVRSTYDLADRPLRVIPPWAHEQHIVESINDSNNAYRRDLGIHPDQIVVMYAGNHHSFVSMDTLLEAARLLGADPRFAFVFAGGGLGKADVDRYIATHQLSNARSLPYQPQESLGDLLGAADIHLVTMGDQLVGITHPCKVYGAMSAGRPVLFVGPRPSHVSELIDRWDIGWRFPHGLSAEIAGHLVDLASSRRQEILDKGRNARKAIVDFLPQQALIEEICTAAEASTRR